MSLWKIIGVLATVMSFAVILSLILGSILAVPYGNIALIKIHGAIGIETGDLFSTSIDATSIVSYLGEAELNPAISAVILDIDSGGGTVVASAIIMEKVSSMTKPVIALIRDVGASGAYWVASACDKIVAHNFSTLGSIGVSSAYLEFSGLLERFNVSYVNLSYPEYKDMLSPYKEPTQYELDLMTEKLQEIYESFVRSVADNRGIPLDEMRLMASGEIYLGYEAKELGLIDVIGSDNEALKLAMQLGDIETPLLITYERRVDVYDLLAQYLKSINPLKTERSLSIMS